MVKTQNELLCELERETNDRFRLMEAMLDDNTKEIAKLREELQLYKTIFKYIGQVADTYKEEVPKSVTMSISELKRHLRGIFGKRLLTEDFMQILVDKNYVTRYKAGPTSVGYKTRACGVSAGWLEFRDAPGRATYTPRFTEHGIKCVIEELKNAGWKEL